METATLHVQTKNGTGIQYHNTVVVEFLRNGRIRLDSGGFKTPTTKKRINDHTPDDIKVIQRREEWFVVTPEGEREFKDMMIITVGTSVSSATGV